MLTCNAQSVTDRTLDQQCTVTRPGIAAIASALLVEIFVSVLQHPQGALAPGPSTAAQDGDVSTDGSSSHPLGIVPHQIRGYLARFQNMLVKGVSYDHCSACSPNILAAYDEGGWRFVKKVLNEKGYVEELSGLAAVSQFLPLFPGFGSAKRKDSSRCLPLRAIFFGD